ncbi:MAG TPA: hypothetical protein VH415_08310 [Nitrososphaeraceae archaeon]|jgi:hypothetical protein
MSELLRGTITVMILVIAISVIYFVIQNYKDKKFAEEVSKQDQRNAQDQANKTKLEAEKDKVDTLVNTMQNHTATEAETTEKTESPF